LIRGPRTRLLEEMGIRKVDHSLIALDAPGSGRV
jgi:hypothetical protein